MKENRTKEDEIDLIEFILKIWRERRVVIKSIIIAEIIGLFIAVFSSVEYTATTIIVPTIADKGAKGGIGGLAAMAGINLSSSPSDVLSPTLYPKIIESIPFKKELIETKINIEDSDKPVTYKEYYNEFYTPSLLGVIKKYTIGLPSVIFSCFRGGDKSNEQKKSNTIIFTTKEEAILYKVVKANLLLNVNDKEGYVKLSVSMPEPLAAAQVTEKAQQLLQKYIIKIKCKKAKEQLLFIQERFKEQEHVFRKAEYALANFQDRNKNVISVKAKTIERHLQTEYNLAYGVYSELSKQIEQQKIKVEEDTPVFSIVEPVSVPIQRSGPKRIFILIISLFLGGVIGVGTVFLKELFQELKNRK